MFGQHALRGTEPEDSLEPPDGLSDDTEELTDEEGTEEEDDNELDIELADGELLLDDESLDKLLLELLGRQLMAHSSMDP